MTLLRKIALVLLVALWVPATSHCLLVALSGLESPACCSEIKTDSSEPHDSDCSTDGCAGVESGRYKTEHSRLAAPQPLMTLVLFDAPALDDRPSILPSAGEASDPLPTFVTAVQFQTRTALPARAPDAIL